MQWLLRPGSVPRRRRRTPNSSFRLITRLLCGFRGISQLPHIKAG